MHMWFELAMPHLCFWVECKEDIETGTAVFTTAQADSVGLLWFSQREEMKKLLFL